MGRPTRIVARHPEYQKDTSTWAMRYQEAGSTAWKKRRLQFEGKPIKATCRDFESEDVEIRNKVHEAWEGFIQDRIENITPRNCPYKTWDAAIAAYIKWYSENHRGRGPAERMRLFQQEFGGKPLIEANKNTVRRWVETSILPRSGAWDTLRLTVAAPQGMVSWLKLRDEWPYGDNPFNGLSQEYAGRFKMSAPGRMSISDDEHTRMLTAAADSRFRAARVFIQVSRFTGLRPEEVYKLDASRLDRSARTWSILVTKTRGRSYYRTIAVPDALISFLLNESITTGALPLSGLKKQFYAIRDIAGAADIEQKTFRKDFANRMRRAGAPKDLINLHQRGKSSDVQDQHYLDEAEAVTLCRPFIEKMFGSKTLRLVQNVSSGN